MSALIDELASSSRAWREYGCPKDEHLACDLVDKAVERIRELERSVSVYEGMFVEMGLADLERNADGSIPFPPAAQARIRELEGALRELVATDDEMPVIPWSNESQAKWFDRLYTACSIARRVLSEGSVSP